MDPIVPSSPVRSTLAPEPVESVPHELFGGRVRLPEDALEEPPSRLASGAVATVFTLFLIAWVVALGYVRSAAPGLDHGDNTADANILNGGLNFDRDGWLTSAGVPAVDTFRGEGATPDFYATYPPGAYWFHQVVKFFGARELVTFRLVSIGVSGLAAWLFFVFVWRLSGRAAIGALAGVFYVASRPFLEYADGLNYISLSQLTLMGSLLAWLGVERAAKERASLAAQLVLTWVCVFLDSWLTFEHTLFILLFFGLRALLLWRRSLVIGWVIIGAAPALALAIRLCLNAYALGGFGEAIRILRTKAGQRTGLAQSNTLEQVIAAWKPRLGGGPDLHPTVGDAEFMFPLLKLPIALPAVGLLLVLLATWHAHGARPLRRALTGSVLLTIGGLTWLVAMKEHAIIHKFVIVVLLPGLAALLGTLVAAGLAQWRLHPAPIVRAPVRLIGPALAIALLVSFGASLRHSAAVNRLVPLDERLSASISDKQRAGESYIAAQRSMAGIKRLYMYAHDPAVGNRLGVPFDNDVGVMHAPLAEGQAQHVQVWASRNWGAAVTGLEQAGLPDLVSPFVDRQLVFMPGRAELHKTNISARDFAVTHVRVAPCLDRRFMSVQIVVAGIERPEEAKQLQVRAALVGADGRTARSASASAGQRFWREETIEGQPKKQRVRNGVCLWAYLPVEAVDAAASISISLHRQPGATAMRLSATGSQALPQGASLAIDGRSLNVPLRAGSAVETPASR